MEKALFYEKGALGKCHLVNPEKLKKYCPAVIQVLESSETLMMSTFFSKDQSLYVFCRSEEEKVVEQAEQKVMMTMVVKVAVVVILVMILVVIIWRILRKRRHYTFIHTFEFQFNLKLT